MCEWRNKTTNEWMNVILHKEGPWIFTVHHVSSSPARLHAASPCLRLDLQWPLSIVFIKHFKIFVINVSETISIWTFRILWFMRSHSVTKQSRLQGVAMYPALTTDYRITRWWADIKKSACKIQGKRSKKGKAIPLQAWTGPEGSRRLRLLDFKTVGTLTL